MMERFRRWRRCRWGCSRWRWAGSSGGSAAGTVLNSRSADWRCSVGRCSACSSAAGEAALVIFGALIAVLGLVRLLPQPQAQAMSGQASLLDPGEYSETALARRATGRPCSCGLPRTGASPARSMKAWRSNASRPAPPSPKRVSSPCAATGLSPTSVSRMLTRQGAAGVPPGGTPGGEAEQLPQVLTPDLLMQARASEP